jgi:hypothetical protein
MSSMDRRNVASTASGVESVAAYFATRSAARPAWAVSAAVVESQRRVAGPNAPCSMKLRSLTMEGIAKSGCCLRRWSASISVPWTAAMASTQGRSRTIAYQSSIARCIFGWARPRSISSSLQPLSLHACRTIT